MKSLLTIGSLLLVLCSGAQNLVQNASFEDMQYCPSNFNQRTLRILRSWTQPTAATPDYFNACSDKAGVPNNVFGSEPAVEGKGYAGIVTYTSTKRNYREYLQTKLTRKLNAGEMICVEYWLSAADKALYVTDGFGAYFSQSEVKRNDQKRIEVIPQVANPRLHILDEKDTWVKISDTFIAQGGEQYLTLGNFGPDNLLNILKRTERDGADGTSNWGYVYVDDIVVKQVNKREECSCVNDLIKEEVHDPPLELQEYRELSLNTLRFDFDDSTLTELAQEKLKETAKVLRKQKYTYVEIIGHTDIVGREGYNLELSKNRAKAVIDYLVDKGIDPNRLTINYYGSEQPMADNSTAEGRAENRRVEFLVLERKFVLAEE